MAEDDSCSQLERIINELVEGCIRVDKSWARVEIERRNSGGIQLIFTGRFLGGID